MSRKQEQLEQGEYRQIKTRDYGNVLFLVLALVTICICTVMLVMVINLRSEMVTLKEEIGVLNNNIKNIQADNTIIDVMNSTSQIVDIYNNPVDDAEAADIVEVAELENILWDKDTENSFGVRRVYLTFDDGPSSSTDEILDILKQYGVKATFFVVGKQGYNTQYKRIVEEGHTLGMHSYSHLYNEIYHSLNAYKQDLAKLHDYLYEITGVDSNIVRFPGGSSNTISDVDMFELIDYLNKENIAYYDWNVSGGDADMSGNGLSAEQIADNVLNNIEKYNNAVVLLHDAGGKKTTVEALPIIIEKILESQESVFLPITEDSVPVQHLHR